MATATTKYPVFSTARPGQGGTGHIDKSSHDRGWWIERFTNADRGPGAGKIRVLPQLSRGIRCVTGWDSAYGFGTNLIAFGAPGFGEDVVEIPQIAQDYNFNPPRATEHKFVGDEADQDYGTKSNLPLHLDIERP